jgi:hypothetical protein
MSKGRPLCDGQVRNKHSLGAPCPPVSDSPRAFMVRTSASYVTASVGLVHDGTRPHCCRKRVMKGVVRVDKVILIKILNVDIIVVESST